MAGPQRDGPGPVVTAPDPMETYILAACFFTSIVANLVLMGAVLAKRQRTSLAFSGQTLNVTLHQGNAHLITGLVLYEKGRHGEAVAMLQEAVRQDPHDRMAAAMLDIALNLGGHGVRGLPPAPALRRLPGRPDLATDGILEAVIHDVEPEPLAVAAPEPAAPAAPEAAGLAQGLLDSTDAEVAHAVRAGLALVHRGETDAALDHFQRLTLAHPDSRIALTGQAIALKHAGREDEAAETLRRTLATSAGTDPQGPTADEPNVAP